MRYNISDEPAFQRLCEETKKLGFQIASLKKGVVGERRTREGLRNLEFSPHVKILYNVTLDDGEDRTEYDAIVLAPFGIFVVEAKNFSGNAYITEKGILLRDDDRFGQYNLGENMNRKEFLLRNCLSELGSFPYYVCSEAALHSAELPVFYSSCISLISRMIELSRTIFREAGVSFISYCPSSLRVTFSGGR